MYKNRIQVVSAINQLTRNVSIGHSCPRFCKNSHSFFLNAEGMMQYGPFMRDIMALNHVTKFQTILIITIHLRKRTECMV